MKPIERIVLPRRSVSALGLGLLGGSFGGLRHGAAQTGPERRVTMKSAAPSLTIAVPLAMMLNRTDRQNGIAVDMQANGTSSTITIEAVLAGQAQFGSPGTADAMQAIRQGAKLRIIAAVVNNLQVMVVRDDVLPKLGVPPTAPVEDRVRALKGLTIGTGAVGSTHYQILRSYLRQYRLDPDKDVRLVGMGETSALIAGIQQKRYDAIAYASPIVEQAVARRIASVWISGPRGDIPGSDAVKTCVIVTRSDTLEKSTADADALRAALTAALRTVREDHAATGRALRESYFPSLDPEVWTTAWQSATAAYPATLAFPRDAFEYWAANDVKGPESYKSVDYTQVVYAPAQS